MVLSWRAGPAVAAQAVLVAESGRARSDRDFVWFDAPRHVSQAVTLDPEPEPGTARLSVSLPRTGSEVAGIVVIGSVPGSLAEVAGLRLTVFDHDRPVVSYDVDTPEPVPAMVLGEFARGDGDWEFRAAREGAVSLAGLVREFGIRVDPVRAPEPRRTAPPPDSERADWHPDPRDPTRLRWWDGDTWTASTRPAPPPDSRHCPRCGAPRRRRLLSATQLFGGAAQLFGGSALCRECADETAEYLADWSARAERTLRRQSPHEDWETLWAALRYQRIDRAAALELLRTPAHEQLERLVAFTCADGVVEREDLDDFEDTVAQLSLSGPLLEDLRRRLHRGRLLTRLRSGELPLAKTAGLHLDPDERVHLDLPAAHVRHLARGPKRSTGRLIVSNRKLRFTGSDAGIEIPWARVVSVSAADGLVEVSATSARGGALLEVADPGYVAAAMEGALRIAKRLALAPGRRDTRTIPPDVKAIVWQRDGGKCVECGDSHYLEFDHIIPISRGGATSPANLQILCRGCNRTKSAHI
ncbi:TerD family protein [Nocardia yunnanensis]|uniref:TerD family protein n=1 Tax=Nocardia yunnanensis TaxID=2382165 RepID=UPI001FE724DD|nr:TerD family protein [Nocardia yunnanensis]